MKTKRKKAVKSVDSIKRSKSNSRSVLKLSRSARLKKKNARKGLIVSRNILSTAKIFTLFKDAAIKAIAIALIVGLNWFSISSIGSTMAYFSDAEISKNNLFSAAQLDFNIELLRSDGFRTQTQGGWGARPHGNNSAAYRDLNFASAFPDGLTVGDQSKTGNYAYFTSSEAIENFLPAGGTSGVLADDYTNPVSTEAGVLAGQTVALTLNLGFDESDSNFSLNDGLLGDLFASDLGSACEKMAIEPNMKVREILAEANVILSGAQSRFSSSEMNDCVTAINERFDNGDISQIVPEGETVWRDVEIKKLQGINFRHGIKVEELPDSDSDLCAALQASAYFGGDLIYSGGLLNLNYYSFVYSETANKWRLVISLPANAPDTVSKKNCKIKYVVSGNQENIDEPLGGFSDTEDVSDVIYSGYWQTTSYAPGFGSVVLNEFLPNPEGEEYGFDFGKDSDKMPKGEWVELYNLADEPFDIANWYIQDLAGNQKKISASNSSLGSTIIPAKSWMVVYLNKAMLDNSGNEKIMLFDSNGNMVDSYSYSGADNCDLEPTPGNGNQNIPSGNCAGVPGNKSYARIPDGTGNWVDPIPTPGKTNNSFDSIQPQNIVFDFSGSTANDTGVLAGTSTENGSDLIQNVGGVTENNSSETTNSDSGATENSIPADPASNTTENSTPASADLTSDAIVNVSDSTDSTDSAAADQILPENTPSNENNSVAETVPANSEITDPVTSSAAEENNLSAPAEGGAGANSENNPDSGASELNGNGNEAAIPENAVEPIGAEQPVADQSAGTGEMPINN